VLGVWPSAPFDSRGAFYFLTLALAALGVLLLRKFLFAPFGYAMRAGRDSPLRAEAIGLDVKRVHWLAFAIAGAVCGIAGGLFAFAKGSISPETIGVSRSIDGLVMVLLGGIQTLTGPIVGASVYAVLQDFMMRSTEYWRALARRHHSAAGAGLPEWHRRRLRQADLATKDNIEGRIMSDLAIRSLSKSFGGVRAVNECRSISSVVNSSR
jgi:ABC-type branched-subunit amino acid transport system permease subunit